MISNIFCNSYLNQWAFNFSNPKTQIMVGIMELHDHLLFFILMIFTLKIVFFVKSLSSSTLYTHLTYHSVYIKNDFNNLETIKKFNRDYAEFGVNNKFRNATLLEFLWTILPGIILIIMAIPSFILLYSMEEGEWPIYNICAIGNQWYWSYEYMDFDIHKYYKIFINNLANIKVSQAQNYIRYLIEADSLQSDVEKIEFEKVISDVYFFFWLDERSYIASEVAAHLYELGMRENSEEEFNNVVANEKLDDLVVVDKKFGGGLLVGDKKYDSLFGVKQLELSKLHRGPAIGCEIIIDHINSVLSTKEINKRCAVCDYLSLMRKMAEGRTIIFDGIYKLEKELTWRDVYNRYNDKHLKDWGKRLRLDSENPADWLIWYVSDRAKLEEPMRFLYKQEENVMRFLKQSQGLKDAVFSEWRKIKKTEEEILPWNHPFRFLDEKKKKILDLQFKNLLIWKMREGLEREIYRFCRTWVYDRAYYAWTHGIYYENYRIRTNTFSAVLDEVMHWLINFIHPVWAFYFSEERIKVFNRLQQMYYVYFEYNHLLNGRLERLANLCRFEQLIRENLLDVFNFYLCDDQAENIRKQRVQFIDKFFGFTKYKFPYPVVPWEVNGTQKDVIRDFATARRMNFWKYYWLRIEIYNDYRPQIQLERSGEIVYDLIKPGLLATLEEIKPVLDQIQLVNKEEPFKEESTIDNLEIEIIFLNEEENGSFGVDGDKVEEVRTILPKENKFVSKAYKLFIKPLSEYDRSNRIVKHYKLMLQNLFGTKVENVEGIYTWADPLIDYDERKKKSIWFRTPDWDMHEIAEMKYKREVEKVAHILKEIEWILKETSKKKIFYPQLLLHNFISDPKFYPDINQFLSSYFSISENWDKRLLEPYSRYTLMGNLGEILVTWISAADLQYDILPVHRIYKAHQLSPTPTYVREFIKLYSNNYNYDFSISDAGWISLSSRLYQIHSDYRGDHIGQHFDTLLTVHPSLGIIESCSDEIIYHKLRSDINWKSDFYDFARVDMSCFVEFSDSTYSDIEDNIDDTLTIDCQIISESDLPLGYPRLLCTDQVLVLPSETPLRILVTSNDVIHSWSVPSFGIKMDGIPGRINQVLINTPFFGTVWGQCSELCGVNHGFMPIELRVIAVTEFKEYIYLLIRNYLNDFNKSFLLTHSYSGSLLKLELNNLDRAWDDYTFLVKRSFMDYLLREALATPEEYRSFTYYIETPIDENDEENCCI